MTQLCNKRVIDLNLRIVTFFGKRDGNMPGNAATRYPSSVVFDVSRTTACDYIHAGPLSCGVFLRCFWDPFFDFDSTQVHGGASKPLQSRKSQVDH